MPAMDSDVTFGGVVTGPARSCNHYVGIDAGGGPSEGLVAWYRCESAAGTSGTVVGPIRDGHARQTTTGTPGNARVGILDHRDSLQPTRRMKNVKE